MSDYITKLKELIISAQNSIKIDNLIDKLPDFSISNPKIDIDLSEKEDHFIYNSF